MFSWLVYNTLCALPLALLVLLAGRIRRLAPASEHALWLVVLVRLVLPPWPLATGDAPASPTTPPVVSSGEPSWGDELVAWTTRRLGSNWSTAAQRVALVLFLATLSWIVLRELWRARSVERCVRAAGEAPRALREHVEAVAGRLGVRAPRVRVSAHAPGPFLWSLRRPVLVLPESPELPAPTVLAHEFAHLARRDHWLAWLELLVLGLHFWNPMFWLARRRLHFAAELASDAWAVQRFPSERRALASALIDTAERAAGGAFLPRAVQALGMDRRDFEQRLRHVLCAAPARAGRGLLVLVLVAGALSWPNLAAPSLEDFRRALPALPAGVDRTTWEELRLRAEQELLADPESGNALARLGLALLGLSEFDEALWAFERQAELGFEVPRALYNQACVHARAGRPEQGLDCLVRAAERGFPARAYAVQDPDLESVRALPGFAALP